MKKLVVLVVMIVVSMSVLVGCKTTDKGTVVWAYNTYNRDAKVISRVGEEVSAVDNNGEEWVFFIDSDDTLTVGDKIKLVMCDNNTEGDIYDDEIIDYIYQE